MFIGERLKDLRKDKGLTQKELAAILGTKWQVISDYERGKHFPPDDIKEKISKYFDVSLDYLMGLTDEEVSFDRTNVIVFPKGFSPHHIQFIKEIISSIIFTQQSKLKK